MSAYQRFISYMYEYHGNTRHQNCGYARIDNRNQLLKLEIHMKVSAAETEVPLHIYGCFQRDGQLYGIEFGQHLPTLGMVNWRMQCASEDLGQTGISFNDLEGLVLSDESPVSYCSIWNDQSIQPVDLIPYPLPAQEDTAGTTAAASPESAPAPKETSPAKTSATEASPAEDASTSVSDTDSGTSASSDISEDFSRISVNSDNASTDTDNTTSAVSSSAAADTTDNAPSPVQAASAPEVAPSVDALSNSSPEASVAASHATVEEHPRTTPTLVERILAQEFADTSAHAVGSPAEKTVTPPQAPTAVPRSSARWERLTHRFPAANAFTDGELKNCLRIEPKDIPVLRREGFHIAGNRFILHCLQRDSHCLLGRVGDSEQYIFAIPGVYDNQERFMANMFGFPCFRSLDSAPSPAAGQKGYWYRAVH